VDDKKRPRAVGQASQPVGGQAGDAVNAEIEQSLGLFGQARQRGGDAGHGRLTKHRRW